MQKLLEAKNKVKWNDDLRSLYKRFPAMVRSKEWPKVVSLAVSGDIDKAWEIAVATEKRNFSYKVQNTIARSIRLKRVYLFKLHIAARKELTQIFLNIGEKLSKKVEVRADSTGKVGGLHKEVDLVTKELRVEIRKWLVSLLRQSTILGLKNAGDTFQPILKNMVDVTKEAVDEMHAEWALLEEPLNFPTKGTKGFTGKVPLWSQKWKNVRKAIVSTIVKSNKLGISAESRIIELTQRAGNEMKKIIANNIVQGISPAKTARDIKKYLSPEFSDAITNDEPLSRGVYRSVYKNAMRVARTESNRAYAHAGLEWANGKDFISGVRIILSPNHSETDECDDLAARGVISIEEATDALPVHPHCMCSFTYEIKDKYLDQEENYNG